MDDDGTIRRYAFLIGNSKKPTCEREKGRISQIGYAVNMKATCSVCWDVVAILQFRKLRLHHLDVIASWTITCANFDVRKSFCNLVLKRSLE